MRRIAISRRLDGMAKKLRCYLGRHRWQKKVIEGQGYFECRDCGKHRDMSSPVVSPPF
jgi:hypothetical protein